MLELLLLVRLVVRGALQRPELCADSDRGEPVDDSLRLRRVHGVGGDLNGIEIHIDYAVTPEQRLFLLAHLFGHTVQWNVHPTGFTLGQQFIPPVDEQRFPQILAYETEAARYGLSLLHETGIHDVDPWFSAYTAADQSYLLNYYRTGEKKDFMSFWNDQSRVLTPEPIPLFTPTKRTFRMDGVVI